MGHVLTLLGTGSGCGVPAFFCDCPACEEARRLPRARRGCCGAMVEGGKRMLIDTPPDLRHYFNREGVREIDELIYTHAHFDHLGGLGELEYMVRLRTRDQLPVYASAVAFENIEAEFHYMLDILDRRVLADGETISFDGVAYTALPVAHAPGTFGYLIETGSTRTFYACDTGTLPMETAERVRGVDALIMDATFWGRSWNPGNHHCVQQTIEEGLSLDAGVVYLTHLAMHYDEPVTLSELERYVAQYAGRVQVGYDGMRIGI